MENAMETLHEALDLLERLKAFKERVEPTETIELTGTVELVGTGLPSQIGQMVIVRGDRSGLFFGRHRTRCGCATEGRVVKARSEHVKDNACIAAEFLREVEGVEQ